jgi:hypothetical protein
MPATYGACVLLTASAIAAAQNGPRRIVDPLFGIIYDPQKVHFDRTPPLLSSRCAQLRDRYTVAWFYGHLKTPDADYFVIDGYREPNIPEDAYGVTVEIRGSSCSVEPTPVVFFQSPSIQKNASGPPMRRSDEVVAALSSELLQRYSSAFGGKKAFLGRVTPQFRDGLPRSYGRSLKNLHETHKCLGTLVNRAAIVGASSLPRT